MVKKKTPLLDKQMNLPHAQDDRYFNFCLFHLITQQPFCTSPIYQTITRPSNTNLHIPHELRDIGDIKRCNAFLKTVGIKL